MKTLMISLVSLLALGGGIALAVEPKPGAYVGKTKVPLEKAKTQPLEFTMGGDGKKIFAFDAPACATKNFVFRSPRVVRPSVSGKGKIKGKLVYTKGERVSVAWKIKVSGKFTSATKAKGKVSVSAVRKYTQKGKPPDVIARCKVAGSWTAKRK